MLRSAIIREQSFDDIVVETQDSLDLLVAGIEVIMESLGEFELCLFVQKRWPCFPELLLRHFHRDAEQVVIGVVDMLTDGCRDIFHAFNALGDLAEVMPGITENGFSSFNVTEVQWCDIIIYYIQAFNIVVFPTVGDCLSCRLGHWDPVGAMPGLSFRVEEKAVRTPLIAEWSAVRMNDKSVSVDICRDITEILHRVYLNQFAGEILPVDDFVRASEMPLQNFLVFIEKAWI